MSPHPAWSGDRKGNAPENTKYVMFGAPRNSLFALSEDVGSVSALTVTGTPSSLFS